MSRPHAVTHMIAWLLAGLLLTACAACDADAKESAGALASARTYVHAIAARDVTTADRMTAADERSPDPRYREVDITAALPQATDPITDPLITPLGPADALDSDSDSYLFNVSYRVKNVTGGGTIELQLTSGADPSQATAWTVTEPLTQTTALTDIGRGDHVGSIAVTDGTRTGELWGYPGGYELTHETKGKQVARSWFALGADDLPAWDAGRS